MTSLFPSLTDRSDAPALTFGTHTLSYTDLASASQALADRIAQATDSRGRVAVWATSTIETAVAIVAALQAGIPAVLLNPKSGERELAHIATDSAPALIMAAPGTELPSALASLERIDIEVDVTLRSTALSEVGPDTAALVIYTSGTTGPPKGVVLSRRAITSNLDALADAWQWTADDVLVHALPLFHVHGLILGILGPLRRGGSVRHLGRFTTESVAHELNTGSTMFFGVPTMYHRIAEALPTDPDLRKALAGARLLVSGSAALPVHDHERIASATGRRVIERYGMTETLMNTSVRTDGPPRTGTVGTPLPGVEVRLVDEAGEASTAYDGETVGELQVRGPNLFDEYLNRPESTAAAFAPDGWFRTGDMAVRHSDGSVRIVGRKTTDLIKSGGYKIGAGEIENVLLEHPGVREAAVTGEPDEDLGERIVAWIVPRTPADPPEPEALAAHVAAQLAPHKRPREVRFLPRLPRNDMGKILKRELRG
ncbi:acyl-CoA synthetase [Streptomyces sp. NPDC090499]|uniref:acyl-CoA synthetase n=1 Tax=Streptomyces sp. NPDC090499 TaxID=3365965 RepID=UPI003819267E